MYTAESVLKALEFNNDLSCEGAESVKCPSSHEGCKKDINNCEICINQKCKQSVSVHRNYQKLVILIFRFAISRINRGGFINKDDSSLKRLLDRDLIDKNKLISI